jgi:8-oxo-dGTP pyrophosphatase MutT (NUDIX family)
MIKRWQRTSSEIAHRYPVFTTLRERFVSPRTAGALDATIMECGDWVNVLPLTDDGHVILIRQYRFGTDSITLEIPGGLIDEGEGPAVAAARELREETGYRARSVTSLGSTAPNPAFIRNRLHCFLAEGCELDGAQEQDPFEDIGVELYPLTELDALIARGGLDHALAELAFHRLKLLRAGHRFE